MIRVKAAERKVRESEASEVRVGGSSRPGSDRRSSERKRDVFEK